MAQGSIDLEIVTPNGVELSEKVEELTAPSVEGEFGVLPQHIPLLAALQTGIVSYTKNGQTQRVAVGPGFFEFADDHAVLLTDKFIVKDAVDPVRARLELKEADEQLDRYHGDPQSAEYANLVQRELWAAVQLELYGDPPPPRVRTVGELGSNVAEDYAKLADESEGESEPAAETFEGETKH
jgi:F-type H+-transporting ATPase subunit epsilon